MEISYGITEKNPIKSKVSTILENCKGIINEHLEYEEKRQRSKDDFQSHTYDEKSFKEARKISNFRHVDK